MTRQLLRTAGALVAVLALVTGAAAAAPAASTTTDGEAAIGPPGGLPDPVPDFVSSILDAITGFLDDVTGGNPGEAVSTAAGAGGS